ncbi:MAG TPA: Hsp20/alpha crystallin family protein [Planctomycetota bacterium]|nr:Hsp20/alpha crystallin family protein [Planctomycetota bacterium]
MERIAIDVIDAGVLYLVDVALPGVLEADINVTFRDSRLLIHAERPPASGVYLSREIPQGVFFREILLPDPVELVGALLEEGVLRLTLRKKGDR